MGACSGKLPGKRLFDAVIDLPFALPTAVAGVALYGDLCRRWLDWAVCRAFWVSSSLIYSQAGSLALMFIGIPFVVRTVQPVLEGGLEAEVEEAFHAGGRKMADIPYDSSTGSDSTAADGFCSGFCPGHWRIWLGCIYLRQYADEKSKLFPC